MEIEFALLKYTIFVSETISTILFVFIKFVIGSSRRMHQLSDCPKFAAVNNRSSKG